MKKLVRHVSSFHVIDEWDVSSIQQVLSIMTIGGTIYVSIYVSDVLNAVSVG